VSVKCGLLLKESIKEMNCNKMWKRLIGKLRSVVICSIIKLVKLICESYKWYMSHINGNSQRKSCIELKESNMFRNMVTV
jgi:hypothetical protein